MLDTPQITQTSVQQTAVIHITVPRSEIQNVMGPGLQELMRTVAAQGITPIGPWFTHHLRRPSETFDFEIGVRVSTPVSQAGRVKPGQLPATKLREPSTADPTRDSAPHGASSRSGSKPMGTNPPSIYGKSTRPDPSRAPIPTAGVRSSTGPSSTD